MYAKHHVGDVPVGKNVMDPGPRKERHCILSVFAHAREQIQYKIIKAYLMFREVVYTCAHIHVYIYIYITYYIYIDIDT